MRHARRRAGVLPTPPGGPSLFEKRLDAFAPFGRRTRFSDAASRESLESVIDRAISDPGYEPFRARLRLRTSGKQIRNHALDRFVEATPWNDLVNKTQSARFRG
jgi:hypothetical protein